MLNDTQLLQQQMFCEGGLLVISALQVFESQNEHIIKCMKKNKKLLIVNIFDVLTLCGCGDSIDLNFPDV